MELLITLFCGAGTIVLLMGLLFFRSRMRYWQQRQIPHDKPKLFLGNMKRNTHDSEPIKNLYKKYKGTAPFCGLYYYMTPAVVALDLDLIKNVLIKDFNNFADRGFFYNEIDDPLSAHLFSLDGLKWRQLRNKLSPTFTSHKMKFMFTSVAEMGNRLVKTLSEIIGFDENNSEIVDMKDFCVRFTTDVIGTCVFGIESNCLADPNDQFRKYGRLVFGKQNLNLLVLGFMHSCPKLARMLRLRLYTREVEEFFMAVVKGTMEYREKNNIQKNDFMSTLIDLKNNKGMCTEDGEIFSTGLTMEEVAAQAFVFWIAGFETASSTMTYVIYELARNIDIQEKLRKSIDEVLIKHNGELTYESIKKMNYLDQVIDETLRLYPIVPILQRVSNADYYLTSDDKFKIENGSLVFIPVKAIHYDPEIYPNPTKFDPERFSPEEKAKRESVAYLPFGEGPRNCIGLRFGKMQVTIGLALLIKNFRFSWCEETPKQLKFNAGQPILVTIHDIQLKVEKVYSCF